LLAVALLIQFVGSSALAQLVHSAKGEIWDNPFLAYGYNPKTQILTGYLAALRTAPGRTDECKLVFAGNAAAPDALSVRYLGTADLDEEPTRPESGVRIVLENNEYYLKFSKKSLDGECDWILPFVVGSHVLEAPDKILVSMKLGNIGSWVAVYAIGSKRAKFYSHPNSKFIQRAFVVKGDVVYVYDERPEWYFVQFKEGKRKTVGWIRKSDTVQP
jgi:hypothetical protein